MHIKRPCRIFIAEVLYDFQRSRTDFSCRHNLKVSYVHATKYSHEQYSPYIQSAHIAVNTPNNYVHAHVYDVRVPVLRRRVLRSVINHRTSDASNHRTPSKYRTEIQVIPTSIHLRLLPAESAFTAIRNAHLLHQGFD